MTSAEITREVDALRLAVERERTRRDGLQNQIKEIRKALDGLVQQSDSAMKARTLMSEASRLTQIRVKERIEGLVTLAIRSVFDRDYHFILNIEIKRNKSEIQLLVQEGGKEPYVPKDDQGGGILDVISYALRVVLWSLENPRSRPLFILDEPMKWTGVLITRAGRMIKEISEKLGIQVLMVTHDPELMEVGDRVWRVEFADGRSVVTEERRELLGPAISQSPPAGTVPARPPVVRRKPKGAV